MIQKILLESMKFLQPTKSLLLKTCLLINTYRILREVDKEKLKKVFFQKISKLEKEDLKKEKYYNFFENLATKLNL